MLRRRILRFAVAPVVLAAVPSLSNAQRPVLSDAEIRDLARSAYLFAYPLVLMEFTRRGAPTNVFSHAAAFPEASFRGVVRPNVDTLYSTAWLDLAKEPILLKVPDTGGRYYVLQLLDAWTETFAAPGKRTTGNREGWFAIVGPGWRGELPAGVRRLDAPTNTVWLLGRTQTNTTADYENVRRIQQGFRLMSLSRYPDGAPASPSLFRAASGPPPAQVNQLGAIEFFREFQQLLQQNPPHDADAPVMKQIARLGLEPGKSFDAEPLGAEGLRALEEGVKAAVSQLTAKAPGTEPAGWTGFGSQIGRYGTEYLSRAKVARTGLGALPPEEAIYLSCSTDRESRPFEGAGRYQIHFSPGNLPPVRAFWSVTLYDPAGYFYANPQGRYAIGDRDKLELNPDGSLHLYILHDSPGGAKERNWLPAPGGAFNLTLRMYWPKEDAIAGRWTPPAVIRQP